MSKLSRFKDTGNVETWTVFAKFQGKDRTYAQGGPFTTLAEARDRLVFLRSHPRFAERVEAMFVEEKWKFEAFHIEHCSVKGRMRVMKEAEHANVPVSAQTQAYLKSGAPGIIPLDD